MVEFATEFGTVAAVRDLSLTIRRGETVVLVGESGAGKSVTALAIMQLVRRPAGRVRRLPSPSAAGTAPSSTLRAFPSARCASPRQRDRHDLPGADDVAQSRAPVGEQIAEAIGRHRGWAGGADAQREAARRVGIARPARRATAVSASTLGGHAPAGDDRHGARVPAALLIADEPTTALDVTIQAQILDLMRGCRRARHRACCSSPTISAWSRRSPTAWPSCTPAGSSSRARSRRLFARPLHPYTRGCSSLSRARRRPRPGAAVSIRGIGADLRRAAAAAAASHPRCPLARRASAGRAAPPLEVGAPGTVAASTGASAAAAA